MTTWAMAPAEHSSPRFQPCWDYNHDHQVISIGWDLGQPPESRDHLTWLWEEYALPEWRITETGNDTDHGRKMLEKFWFDVEPGDIVVAKAGLSKYVGIGEFGTPFYDKDAYRFTWGCSLRHVVWESYAQEQNSPIRFAQHTIYALKPEQAAQFGL